MRNAPMHTPMVQENLPLRWFALALAFVALLASARPAPAQAINFDAPKVKIETAANYTAVHPGQKAAIAVILDIAKGFHAQSTVGDEAVAFKVTAEENPQVRFLPPIYPPAKDIVDRLLGKLNVYEDRVVVYIPFEVKADAPPGDLRLGGSIHYQLCEEGSCLPPEDQPFTIQTRIVPATEKVEPAHAELFKDYNPAQPTTLPATQPVTAAAPATTPPSADNPRNWSLPVALGAALLAGLIFNVMPCVLPVLPLKALGFYEVSQHNRSKSLALGAVFSLGLISVFIALAFVVLIFRALVWGQLFSNVWFASGIALILVVMALSMFGLFNFNLPPSLYSFSPRHDTYLGNYLFGAFTAILSTPCTGPVFPLLMTYAASQAPAVAILAMTSVGVGMAAPYLLLSGMPELARNLPRSGPWSELVKQMLGFVLLAAAVFYVGGQFVSGQRFWWIIVAISIVGALYLLGRTAQLTRGGVGVAVASVVAMAMIAGPLVWTVRQTGLLTPASSNGTPTGIPWQPYSEQAVDAALKQGRTVMLEFTADWCGNCQYLEQTVFHRPDVVEAVSHHKVIPLRADLTREDAPGWPKLRKLNAAGGIPLTVILSPSLSEPIQLDSIYSADSLITALARASQPSIALSGGK